MKVKMSDLQEAIHQNLVNSMSHDKLTRDGAEQQLKMLETKEGECYWWWWCW